MRLVEDPTDFSSLVRDGVVHLPNRAGLGVDVDEEHVNRLAIDRATLGASR
jgi:muconate cycloisomerase